MPQGNRRTGRFSTLTVIAIGLLLICNAGITEAAEPGRKMRVSVGNLVNYFDTIVFGSEHGPKYASTVVAKWKGPVGIDFQGRVSDQHKKFVWNHLRILADITRLEFREVDTDADIPGISLKFVNKSEMGKIPVPEEYRAAMENSAANSNCYFMIWKQPESRFVKGIIVVNVEKDLAVLNSCLLEELTQSLGLPNDSDILRPSVFSDRDRLYKLGPQDKVLLHTLYHPRMQAGLPKAEALKIAREIIEDLARPAKPSTSRDQGG